jgi:hypothetical protein
MDGTNTIFSCDRNKAAQLLAGPGTVTPPVTPVYAAAMTVHSGQGLYQKIVTTSAVGNATVNITYLGKFGELMVLEIANDAGGARTITFGTNFRSTGTVVGTASKSIIVGFFSDGAGWKEAFRSAAAA